jgi:PBP1b-binding outer membrane lipoprotein LpoB
MPKEVMMRIVPYLMLAIVVVALSGCSDPTIDASSDESMKQSVQKVRESLPESKRAEFDEAMQVLAFSQVDMKELFAEGAAGVGNLEGKVRQSLDGKTGEQVIAEAEHIKAERKERERQQALEEIRELVAKRAKSESARQQLKKFQVLRSRFYMREREFMGKQPIIELTVKNGTEHAVSRAYFEGTLASPDRSVPWHKDTFNYSIPGGLEPGEEATWNLAPNMFSDWGKADAPAEAVFTVTVEQLDGPDGEPIYSTREFSDYDRERLNELKKKYGVE